MKFPSLLAGLAAAVPCLVHAAPTGDIGLPADYKATQLNLANLDGATPDANLPTSFDWRSFGMVTTPKDQGSCGGCWAFASVGVLESKLLLQGLSTADLSEQQQLSCNTNMSACGGGSMSALQHWNTHLPILEGCSPYTASSGTCAEARCGGLFTNTNGYYTVNMSVVNDLKRSIYDDGPAYFRFDTYADFQPWFFNNANAGRTYVQTNTTSTGGHAVLVIGWDNNRGWLCKNSWGATAGNNGDGTFWIAFSGHTSNLNFGAANMRLMANSVKPDYYLGTHADLANAFGTSVPRALQHWRNYGASEGRNSSPVFDVFFYFSTQSDVAKAVGTYVGAKEHWLTFGIREGRTGSPAFDPKYYLQTQTTLARTLGASNYPGAQQQWLDNGLASGLRGSKAFDPKWYLANNADLLKAFGSTGYEAAVRHWFLYGIREGRQTASDFSIKAYVNRYADLKAAFGTNYTAALMHWFQYGQFEGRNPAP